MFSRVLECYPWAEKGVMAPLPSNLCCSGIIIIITIIFIVNTFITNTFITITMCHICSTHHHHHHGLDTYLFSKQGA